MKHPFYGALAVWFTFTIVIMLGVATVGYFSFTQTFALGDSVAQTRDVINMLDDVLVAATDLEIGSRTYVITGDSSILERYGVGHARLGQLTEKLEMAVQDDPGQVKRTQQLRVKLLEGAEISSRLVALRDKTGFDQARRLVAGGQDEKVTGEIRALISAMKGEEEKLLLNSTQNATTARTGFLSFGGVGGGISLGIIVLVFWLVRREGLRRLSMEAELSAANRHPSSSLQQAQRLMQDKRMIDHLAALLHSCSSIEDAREVIGKELRQALPGLPGVVYLFRPSHNMVEEISHWDEPHALEDRTSFSPDECWALKSGLQHVMRTRDDVACGHVDPTRTQATACVPMNMHGELIGVMHKEGSADQFDEARLDLIRRIAVQVGMSLGTLQLQQQLVDQSFRDPMTGLFNRRYFETAIEKEVSRTDRQKQTIGFVMIDIDHVNTINDRYGHHVGDLVLKGVSDTLSRHSRKEDITCRYGGEEFLLVFPGASVNATRELAETLRKAVEKRITVLSDGTRVSNTTISLGVAAYPTQGTNWQDVERMADQALYRAKEQGRNRVVVAETAPVAITTTEHELTTSNLQTGICQIKSLLLKITGRFSTIRQACRFRKSTRNSLTFSGCSCCTQCPAPSTRWQLCMFVSTSLRILIMSPPGRW